MKHCVNNNKKDSSSSAPPAKWTDFENNKKLLILPRFLKHKKYSKYYSEFKYLHQTTINSNAIHTLNLYINTSMLMSQIYTYTLMQPSDSTLSHYLKAIKTYLSHSENKHFWQKRISENSDAQSVFEKCVATEIFGTSQSYIQKICRNLKHFTLYVLDSMFICCNWY